MTRVTTDGYQRLAARIRPLAMRAAAHIIYHAIRDDQDDRH